MNGLFTGISGLSWFVGVLTLLAGVIGVSNIMLIVVKERTREIGIRRAVGATPAKIRSQILVESVFLTIISGMAGIVFGAVLIYGLNYALDMTDPIDMFANPSVNLGVITTALTILIVSGLFAGLIPAQNATGNWIKVVQRVPVRIKLDSTELKAHPLTVGLSMTVRINIDASDK